MVPPDGVRSKRLPTMSWESVVDEATTSGGEPADALRDASPVAGASPAATGLGSPAATAPLTQPAPFDLSIDLGPTPPADRSSTTPVDEPVVQPISFSPLTLGPTAADPAPEPPVVRFAPISPIVAAIVDAEPSPIAEPEARVDTDVEVAGAPEAPAPPVADIPSTELPRIVEATPVPDGAAFDVAEPATDSGPRLPHVQQAVRPQPAAVVYEMPIEHQLVGSIQRPRRKSRSGLKLLVTLVILGGLVAGAVVYGRPYLFPDGWDDATQPYAEAVETLRGVEYVEPIAVIAEPTADYTARLGAELVGDWSADEAALRALGLLNGPTTEESVTELLADWQDAVYSTDDGQVYTDIGVTGAQVQAEITREMAAASLDQEFLWSAEQPNRTLDDQALTLAEVQRQASAVLAQSPFAVELEPASPGIVAFVPPVVGYRALASATYAEFENPVTGDVNALSGIGTAGPGPLSSQTPVAAAAPTLIDTDTLVGSPRSLDRSFWFLVFAGFLDSRTSYQASESVVENSLSVVERADTQCVYATFSGGDVARTETLRAALEAWSASAPVEFGSSFSVLADGTLQLVTCDPGVGFETVNRLGVARELVGWRTAELATLEAIRTANGTEADAAAAWAAVEASTVGVDLGALPGDTSPAESADAARAAVAAVLAPVG
jgi:hypothetical protein